MSGKVVSLYSNGSQPVCYNVFGGLNDPFPGVTFQISCILDINITINNCNKITAMKEQQE